LRGTQIDRLGGGDAVAIHRHEKLVVKRLELVERETAIRLGNLRSRAASHRQLDHGPAQWFARGVVEFSPPAGVFAEWLLSGCWARSGWAKLSPASKGSSICTITTRAKKAWTAGQSCATIIRSKRVFQDACYRAYRTSCTRHWRMQRVRFSSRKTAGARDVTYLHRKSGVQPEKASPAFWVLGSERLEVIRVNW
jgi:hypothetical protein